MGSKLKKGLKNQKGFTLIELITVIVVLGIILGIGLPRYNMIRAQSEWDADVVTLRNMEKAAVIYYTLKKDKGFPSGPGGVIADCTIDGETFKVVEVTPCVLESAGLFDKKTVLKRLRKDIYADLKSETYTGNAWDSVYNTDKFNIGDFYIFVRVKLETGDLVWRDDDNDGVNDWISYYLGNRPK